VRTTRPTIEDSVVIGVDDLFLAAGSQIVGLADRSELLERWRITLVVSRSMISHLMKDDKNVSRRVAIDVVLQTTEHAFVPAFHIANGIRLVGTIDLVFDAVRDMLRARIVVAP
jgi:hypothetical protein